MQFIRGLLPTWLVTGMFDIIFFLYCVGLPEWKEGWNEYDS